MWLGIKRFLIGENKKWGDGKILSNLLKPFRTRSDT
jgi:hypothetical protein